MSRKSENFLQFLWRPVFSAVLSPKTPNFHLLLFMTKYSPTIKGRYSDHVINLGQSEASIRDRPPPFPHHRVLSDKAFLETYFLCNF